jgi:hypothetical protein
MPFVTHEPRPADVPEDLRSETGFVAGPGPPSLQSSALPAKQNLCSVFKGVERQGSITRGQATAFAATRPQTHLAS